MNSESKQLDPSRAGEPQQRAADTQDANGPMRDHVGQASHGPPLGHLLYIDGSEDLQAGPLVFNRSPHKNQSQIYPRGWRHGGAFLYLAALALAGCQ